MGREPYKDQNHLAFLRLCGPSCFARGCFPFCRVRGRRGQRRKGRDGGFDNRRYGVSVGRSLLFSSTSHQCSPFCCCPKWPSSAHGIGRQGCELRLLHSSAWHCHQARLHLCEAEQHPRETFTIRMAHLLVNKETRQTLLSRLERWSNLTVRNTSQAIQCYI